MGSVLQAAQQGNDHQGVVVAVGAQRAEHFHQQAFGAQLWVEQPRPAVFQAADVKGGHTAESTQNHAEQVAHANRRARVVDRGADRLDGYFGHLAHGERDVGPGEFVVMEIEAAEQGIALLRLQRPAQLDQWMPLDEKEAGFDLDDRQQVVLSQQLPELPLVHPAQVTRLTGSHAPPVAVVRRQLEFAQPRDTRIKRVGRLAVELAHDPVRLDRLRHRADEHHEQHHAVEAGQQGEQGAEARDAAWLAGVHLADHQ